MYLFSNSPIVEVKNQKMEKKKTCGLVAFEEINAFHG